MKKMGVLAEWNGKGINSCKPTYSEPTYSVKNCSHKLNQERFVFLHETMKILMIVKKRQRIRIKLDNVLTNLLEIRKEFHIITTNFF